MVDYYITFKDKPFNLAEVQYSVLSSPKHESENRRDEPTLVQGHLLPPKFCLLEYKNNDNDNDNDNDNTKDNLTIYMESYLHMKKLKKDAEQKCKDSQIGVGVSICKDSGNQRRLIMIDSLSDGVISRGFHHKKHITAYDLVQSKRDKNCYIKQLHVKGDPRKTRQYIEEEHENNESLQRTILQIRSHKAGEIPPMFENDDSNPLPRTLARTRKILEKARHWMTDEGTWLLNLLDNAEVTSEELSKMQREMKHPFIVIEGMDCTGKSTLVENLQKTLKEVSIFNCNRVNDRFKGTSTKGLPEIISRAKYAAINYINSKDIAKECQLRPVINDRFWFSTGANAIATESTLQNLPPTDHVVYTWPSDLLRPHLVFYLTVQENIRQERMVKRGDERTEHEESLEQNAYRQRLLEIFKRMSDPPCVFIDASGSKEEVHQRVLQVIRSEGYDCC